MELNFNGRLNMRLKWNKIKQYDEKTKDSDLPYHTMDPQGRGHCGARSAGRGYRSKQSPPPLSCSVSTMVCV
jgi:hypothetical protein